MLGRIRKFIQEYIRDIRISTMSLDEIGELQREADEANTIVIPGAPGEPGIRLRSLYSTLGTKDTDFGTKEDLWGPGLEDEKGAGLEDEKGAGLEDEKGAGLEDEKGAGRTCAGGNGDKNDQQV